MRVFWLLQVLLSTISLPGQNDEALTIVKQAEQAAYYAGKDGRANVRMEITDGRGQKRVREFTILRLTTGPEEQKYYVYFHAPADVRKMAFLVWKHGAEGKQDDRWLWLPALNLSRRIAPGDKRTSFVGSDFVYEDVSGRSLHEDQHRLVETTETQFILEHIPKEKLDFARYRVWIDRDTYLPRKAEYFAEDDTLIRRVEALKVETIDGIATVTHSRAQDLVNGNQTELTFSKIAYNLGLKESLFSERFLRRPPREVVRR